MEVLKMRFSYSHGFSCQSCAHYYQCQKVMEKIEESANEEKDKYLYESYRRIDSSCMLSCSQFTKVLNDNEGFLNYEFLWGKFWSDEKCSPE